MCLPASGAISISQIRNEIVNNGCGGSTYSLSALASAAGFPADPDSMSEFYNYCCSSCSSATFCYSSTSCVDACVPPSGVCVDVVTYWIGSLTVGTVLYTSCASGPVSNGYYSYGGTCYTVSGGGGVITSTNTCPSTIALYGSWYGCVVPDTDILIAPNVTRKAGVFNVGEKVYTKHENTGEWGYYTISVLTRKQQPILYISTTLGDIECSTTHLMLVDGEYIEAGKLSVGSIVSHMTGDAEIVEIITKDVSEVIEFTIDDAHTYVAGGFISHNKCNLYGWANCDDACNNSYTAYTWSNVAYFGLFTIGTYLYPPGTCSFAGNQFYFYPTGWIQVSGNVIVDQGTCPCSGLICHDFQATASSYMTWTDCCGVPQSQYLFVGDTFCAQVGTVYGYYVDLNTSCSC